MKRWIARLSPLPSRPLPAPDPAALPVEGRYRCVKANGLRLYVDLLDRMIGARLAKGGAYEPHVAESLRRALRPGDTFLDLGANVGYFTVLAASLVGPSGRVVAFEPRADNAALLQLSIRENGFQNVELHALAVAEREQTFKVYPAADSSLSHVVEATRQVHGSAAGHTVRAVALDEFLADAPRVDVVKIDVDGNELRAFQGMLGLLRRHRPAVLLEFAPRALERVGLARPEAVLELLAPLYDLFVLEDVPGLGAGPHGVETIAAAQRRTGATHIDLAAYPKAA